MFASLEVTFLFWLPPLAAALALLTDATSLDTAGVNRVRAMRAVHTPFMWQLLLLGVLLAAVCYNLVLTTQLEASMRMLHEQMRASGRVAGLAMVQHGSKRDVTSFPVPSPVQPSPVQPSPIQLPWRPLVQPAATPPSLPPPVAPAPALGVAQNYEPQGLYLGDGKVFCFARPLGRPMMLEGADKGITVHLCRGYGWEPETSDVFRRLVKPGDFVLDVGANVGYYTLLFSDLVGPQGRVLAVEAQPRTWDLVATTVELNGLAGRTQVINKAAFETDGKILQIGASRTRILNNALHLGKADDNAKEADTVPVETITIDTAVAGWSRLDLVKIDVEGAEAHAYAGMRSTLKRFPNLILIMEVNTQRMGVDKALNFYNQVAKDFPQMRKLSGIVMVPTTVQELHANRVSDDMLVLTHRQDILGSTATRVSHLTVLG